MHRGVVLEGGGVVYFDFRVFRFAGALSRHVELMLGARARVRALAGLDEIGVFEDFDSVLREVIQSINQSLQFILPT